MNANETQRRIAFAKAVTNFAHKISKEKDTTILSYLEKSQLNDSIGKLKQLANMVSRNKNNPDNKK